MRLILLTTVALSACVHEGFGHRTSCAHGLEEAQYAHDCDPPVIERPTPAPPPPEPKKPVRITEYPQGHPQNPEGATPLGPGSEWGPDGPQWSPS